MFQLFDPNLPDPLPDDYPALGACPDAHFMTEYTERFELTARTVGLKKGFIVHESPSGPFLYRFVQYDEQRLRWLYLMNWGASSELQDPRDYLLWRARLLRSAQIDMPGFYTSGFCDASGCRTMRTQQRAFSLN